MNVEIITGDLADTDSIEKVLIGSEIVINTAPLSYSEYIIPVCQKLGIKRVLFLSSTRFYSSIDPDFQKMIQSNEERIVKSGLDYTILRPTMIYGTERDRNLTKVIRFIKKYPVLPVFGDGRNLVQPVYVKDLVCAIIQSIESPKTVHKIYDIPGKNPVSNEEMLDTIARLLSKRLVKIHIPIDLTARILKGIAKMIPRARYYALWVERNKENKSYEFSKAAEDFQYSPRSFLDGIENQIHRLKDLNWI